MRDAAEYRTHADECMRLANQLERKEHRETLIQMAQTWLRLAEKRERSVDSKTLLARSQNIALRCASTLTMPPRMPSSPTRSRQRVATSNVC
jgi:hypothetical protein